MYKCIHKQMLTHASNAANNKDIKHNFFIR